MRAALVGLNGVKDAEISFEKKQASVEFSKKGNVTLADLLKAISTGGWRGSAA